MPRDDWEPLDEYEYQEHRALSASWSDLHSGSVTSDYDIALELGEYEEEVFYNAFVNDELSHAERMDWLHEWLVDIMEYYTDEEWEDRYSED